MDNTNKKYIPTPGYILIDPFEKDKKSDFVAVQDSVDKSYKGKVVAVGKSRVAESGAVLESPVKPGDIVLYSIVGIEETKLDFEGDVRKRFVIAPFNRILLTIE